MKIATLNDGSRDGVLCVVSSDGRRFVRADLIAATLQQALDDWDQVEAPLRALATSLDNGAVDGDKVDVSKLHSPLPRAYEWIDGSAYINHIVLVRKARGAEPPATLRTEPLVYQGGSGTFLTPTQDIVHDSEDYGIDFEAEICVVMGDTPKGTKASEAGSYVRLVMLANDITLRNLIPGELGKGFGFFVSKPSTAFSPFAVTPDELGASWRDGRLHRPLVSTYNGAVFGNPDAGPEMHFSFYDLIEHVTRTRALTAGTIIGSGTISNEDVSRGSSCLAEKRMLEKINTGEFKTPFMRYGDTIQIEVLGDDGEPIFGTISQRVVAP